MILNAIVSKDGTSIAKVPKCLWGKRVKVTILKKKHKYRRISSKSVLEEKRLRKFAYFRRCKRFARIGLI